MTVIQKFTLSYGKVNFIFVLQITTIYTIISCTIAKIPSKCEGGGGLKYLWGDALTDSPDCAGPNNMGYPT